MTEWQNKWVMVFGKLESNCESNKDWALETKDLAKVQIKELLLVCLDSRAG